MEEQINWDNLFDDPFFDANFFDPSSILPTSSPNHGNPPLSVDDIDQFLVIDDVDDFLLLDSPLEAEKSGEVVDLSDGDNSVEDQKNKAAVVDHKEEKQNSDDDPSDHLSKKRKRQLRNKDAALRSRERKKMYVKDLEMKSRYYEAECRRLGSLLQCFMAENQALRFSLHSSKAFDASITKQESAVLLLESLLLGSLLWLTGIVCQLVLPSLLQHQSRPVIVEDGEKLQSLVIRKGASKLCGHSLLVGKRFKASRARMRPCIHPQQVISNLLVVF